MPAYLRSMCLPAVLLAAIVSSSLGAEEAVKLVKKTDTVEVTIDGKPLAVYHTSREFPKPFFLPVRSAGGAIVTRPLNDPLDKDHPHHKGVWLAIDEVNGIKYWAEQGKIVNAGVQLVKPEGSPAVMQVTNHWQGEDGKPVVIEKTKISIYPNRLFAYDIQFSPGSGPATFEDTKEGLFGVRLNRTLRERGSSGKVVNADGLEGSGACWGQRSKWVDYYGPVGGAIHGVALFDHPDNPRPSRYHVRNYGLFTISPFGERAYTRGKEKAQPVTIKPGETFRLRYGLYVHPGDTKQGKVAQTYEVWRKNS